MSTGPTPKPVDFHLLNVLKQMAEDMPDPNSHYMVSTSYFDFIDSDRAYTRQHMCPICAHQDSVSNIDFDEQGILLDTFFHPEKAAPTERIRIPYDQIYRIAKNPAGGLFVNEDSVYQDLLKFSMPPVPKS